MLRKGQWLTMRASRQLFQHPNAPPAAPQQACMHPARCAPKRIATRAAASSPTPAAATSTAAAEQYRAVAAWRLALLQANSSSLSDYSLVWRLKGTTFNNRQELIAQLHQGQGIILYKEPSNPAAPHAVAVRTAGMQHLGYLPKHAAQQWQLQACFGSVASVGQVEGYIPWGASVQVKAAAHGVWLDLLPDSWQEAADLQKVLGPQQWTQLQQAVKEQYGQRCAISSMPGSELQQPLRVTPQWRFDFDTKQVQLAHVIPVCEPLFQLKQQLAAAAEQLAGLAPRLQLAVGSSPSPPAGGASSSSGDDGSRSTAASRAEEAAAAAVAALPAEQQEAVKWLGILTPWQQLDCVAYVAHAGWLRERMLQDNWQFVAPDSEALAALARSSSKGVEAADKSAGVASPSPARRGPRVPWRN